MVKLQKPKYVYMGGGLRLWDEATLHVDCEAVNRGLNVFEGIKGYWQVDGTFAFIMVRRHFERLRLSARLLYIPCEIDYPTFLDAVYQLADALLIPEKDMWIRPTLFVTEGHWGEDTVADLVIKAFHIPKDKPAPIQLGVSTWQRANDAQLPARIKTSSNYQVARLARIEGRRAGCEEMILLNQWGRVAEATGSCLLMVRDGTVVTPPASEGALESITLDVVENLAASMDIPFVRRPVDRTELLIADELAICGTLAELEPVHTFDGRPMPDASPILDALRHRFFSAARGRDPHPYIEKTCLPDGNSKTITGYGSDRAGIAKDALKA